MMLTDDRRGSSTPTRRRCACSAAPAIRSPGSPYGRSWPGRPADVARGVGSALSAGRFSGEAELVAGDGSRAGVQWAATTEVVTGRRLVLFVALSTSRWGSRFRRGGEADAAAAALTAARARSSTWSRWARAAPRSPRLQISHDTVRTHVRNAWRSSAPARGRTSWPRRSRRPRPPRDRRDHATEVSKPCPLRPSWVAKGRDGTVGEAAGRPGRREGCIAAPGRRIPPDHPNRRGARICPLIGWRNAPKHETRIPGQQHWRHRFQLRYRDPNRRRRVRLRRGDGADRLDRRQARNPAAASAISRGSGLLGKPDADQQRRDVRQHRADHPQRRRSGSPASERRRARAPRSSRWPARLPTPGWSKCRWASRCARSFSTSAAAFRTGASSRPCRPAALRAAASPKSISTCPSDYESLTSVGSIMGSGGMIVMDDTSCMVDVARYFMEFCMTESCGKCIPCRVGTAQMHAADQDLQRRSARYDGSGIC